MNYTPRPGTIADPIAWTVEQAFRTADLPGELPASLKRGNAAETLAVALDRVWRNRVELCRRTGLSQSSVGRLLIGMAERGEVEVLPASGSRAAQFRRVR